MNGVAEGIGVLMLAAGASRRFGADKRRASLANGRTLLQASLAAVPSSFTLRLLVLRPGDEDLAAHCRAAGWQVLMAPDAARGMGHSLAAGIEAARGWRGALVALADMPFVRPDTYLALATALRHDPIVVPCHGGHRGHPVGFARALFDELALLEGDRGARGVIERHGARELPVDDAGVLRDVDTPEEIPG